MPREKQLQQVASGAGRVDETVSDGEQAKPSGESTGSARSRILQYAKRSGWWCDVCLVVVVVAPRLSTVSGTRGDETGRLRVVLLLLLLLRCDDDAARGRR